MRYVTIAQKDSQRLLVVDTEKLTVHALDAAAGMPDAIQVLRAEGGSIYKGVDVAVASDQRDDASATWYFQGN